MTAQRNPWLVLSLVCMAQFMVILDATIVNVALPSIQTDLEMSDSELQWIVNSYALVFGGFLLLGGRAGDLIGRRRRRRPRARRNPHHLALVAVDLLREHPRRDRGVRGLAEVRPGVEGRARAQDI